MEPLSGGKEAQVLGPIHQPHEFVFVPDAAATILALLDADAAWTGDAGQAWNLGGPAVTTIRDMAELIFQTEGKPARFVVPGAFMMRFVRAMNPYIRELKELDYLLKGSLLLDDTKLSAVLGSLTKTPYAEGVRYTLSLR